MEKNYKPTERVTFVLTEEEKINLKIAAIRMKMTMSDFIRKAISEKMNKIDEGVSQKLF